MSTLAPLSTIHYSDDAIWQRFSIEYDYPVHFTENLFCINNPTLLKILMRREPDKLHRISVFIDEGVTISCPQLVEHLHAYVATHDTHITLAEDPTIIAAGEKIKSDPRSIITLQKSIADQHLDRHSFIIGIGGGALLDAIGLVAATSHRGIRHIRIPTTVLSQNDSGVGVKNGVNLFGQKNYLGTFAPPFAVLNDYNFIKALPERDKIAGMAEAVKVALIRDRQFFTWLEQNAQALSHFEKAPMRTMIRRCAELHMQQIASGGDPFETGSARPLDFGHWAAHRLETISNHTLRHGEAVAIGVALDTRYSVLSDLLEPGADIRVSRLLETLGFTLWHASLELQSTQQELSILQGLDDFREHLGGELTITLLEALGKGIEVHTMNPALVEASIAWLRGRGEPTTAQANTSGSKTEVRNVASNMSYQLNTQAVAKHLHTWLQERLQPEQTCWLESRLHMLNTRFSERELHITLGLIPRKLGRDDLNLSQEAIDLVQNACGQQWDPCDWTIDTAARCLVLITRLQEAPRQFDSLLAELYYGAELNESISFYRCTAVLPQSEAMDELIGVGLRTHIRATFEAVAHRNPYPQLHFDQNRFNHVVLKALFIDSTLWPIQGIDERGNPELASMLCDYAHERWAAHRPVNPELWRCVGPYATGAMIDDLFRALSSDTPLEKQAALLALLSCPEVDHAALRSEQAMLCTDIDAGLINWETIGRAVSTERHSAA